jgi:antitoxin component of MazEF toxin-antitoxin module
VATIRSQVRLRPKNQMTLPEDIVQQIGAEPGDHLILEVDDERPGEVRVRRLLESYTGIFDDLFASADEVKAYLAEERASWGE